MTNLSATSLDVVRLYAAAQEAASKGKFEEARDNALKAVALDPNFGVGYQVAAVASRNLHNQQDAEKYSSRGPAPSRRHDGARASDHARAVVPDHRRLSGLREGIRRADRPLRCRRRRAQSACAVLRRSCGTSAAPWRRCAASSRCCPTAPSSGDNLALYANYAGDFQTRRRRKRGRCRSRTPTRCWRSPLRNWVRASAHWRDETYQKLGTMGALGASLAASGLGDLAARRRPFRGRRPDSRTGCGRRSGVARAPIGRRRSSRRWRTCTSRAGRTAPAIAAAESALAKQQGRQHSLPRGARRSSTPASCDKAQEQVAEPRVRAPARVAGLREDHRSEHRAEKQRTRDRRSSADRGEPPARHLDRPFRSRPRVPGESAFPQADAEFDRCLKRRGEALALFLDEETTYQLPAGRLLLSGPRS